MSLHYSFFPLACIIGVILSGCVCSSNKDQAKEDIDDRVRWPEAHLSLQRIGGPSS